MKPLHLICVGIPYTHLVLMNHNSWIKSKSAITIENTTLPGLHKKWMLVKTLVFRVLDFIYFTNHILSSTKIDGVLEPCLPQTKKPKSQPQIDFFFREFIRILHPDLGTGFLAEANDPSTLFAT